MVSKNPALAVAAPTTMKGASPLCPQLSEDPRLHTPGDGAQPYKEKRTRCSFPPPITSSLTHNICQPALTPFLTQLCRHLSACVLSLFLAFFLSFVLAVFMLLTACFPTQATDFSNGPFLHHPLLPLPRALMSMPEQHLHALAWHCLPHVLHQHVSAVDNWPLS